MRKLAVVVFAVSLVVVLGAGSNASADHWDAPTRDGGHGHWFKHACGAPGAAVGACGVQVVTDSAGTPLASSSPPASAYGPAQFHAAYALPTTAPTVQTIAIVDAYDDPTIESDLAAYDTSYGLPACTTGNGCFTKVNQTGGTSYPAKNAGWALEIALDVETAHQICQNCKILLVEATTASMANLGTAVNEAVALGANVVSNSYGAGEYSSETSDENSYFNHPGVAITVSSGDSGYGVEFPAASQYVTAVGGTTLNLGSGNSWSSETAWSGSGSGCSAYEPKPAWQKDTGCSKRTVADVSADADPNTGAAIFDSTYGGTPSWYQVGGTSLASPLVAAAYALTGNAAAAGGASLYSHASALHDVTSGNNGSCGGSYLCTAVVGYDGPTGLGTPNGLAGFGGTSSPDFTVSTSNVTVTQGTAALFNVTIGSLGGFSGTVSLGQTAGPSGGFNPQSPAAPGSSILTIVTSGVSPGTYTVTITGTSGSTVHSASATLTVQAAAPPDFSLAVSPTSATIGRTSRTSYTVTVTPKNSFTGQVSLGASGFISGTSGSFAPNPATSTSTFTVTATSARRRTRFTVTITGTSGTLSHTATLTLTTGS